MYAFPAGTSYRDLLNSLKSGSFEVEVVVTFNNCKTIHDLCVKVSKCIAVDSTELESYITDQETLNKYGFTIEQVPALFMPNSYRMYYDTGKEAFLERMAKEFKNFWTPESTIEKGGVEIAISGCHRCFNCLRRTIQKCIRVAYYCTIIPEQVEYGDEIAVRSDV